MEINTRLSEWNGTSGYFELGGSIYSNNTQNQNFSIAPNNNQYNNNFSKYNV